MKTLSLIEGLTVMPDSPAFAGLELDGLIHCLNCMSGRVLAFDSEEEISIDSEYNVLCAVLEGSASLFLRSSGEQISVLGKNRVFAFDKSNNTIYSLRAFPGLVMLVFDSARALVPCGNNCEYHLQLMQNLATQMMGGAFIPSKQL